MEIYNQILKRTFQRQMSLNLKENIPSPSKDEISTIGSFQEFSQSEGDSSPKKSNNQKQKKTLLSFLYFSLKELCCKGRKSYVEIILFPIIILYLKQFFWQTIKVVFTMVTFWLILTYLLPRSTWSDFNDSVFGILVATSFKETETAFIENGSALEDPVEITAAIRWTMNKVLPNTLKFEYLGVPVQGLISGASIVLLPTGGEIQQVFDHEKGFRIKIKITEKITNEVKFEGYAYFKAESFNLMKLVESKEVKANFMELVEEKLKFRRSILGKKLYSYNFIKERSVCSIYSMEISSQWNHIFNVMTDHLISGRPQGDTFKILEEKVSERIQNNTFEVTKTEFIHNGDSVRNIQDITAAIKIASHYSLPAKYEFTLLRTPVLGEITGNLIVMMPTGQQVEYSFNKERGYEAVAKITNRETKQVTFQGKVYYRAMCFNPLRAAKDIKSDGIIFRKLHNENLDFRREVLKMANVNSTYFSNITKINEDISSKNIFVKENTETEVWNRIFDEITTDLNERETFVIRFATGQERTTNKRQDELQIDNVLFQEINRIMTFVFRTVIVPLDASTIQRTFYTGKATIIYLNGNTIEKDFKEISIVTIKSIQERNNVVHSYSFTFPDLNPILLATEANVELKTKLQNVKNQINEVRRELEVQSSNTITNPLGNFDVPNGFLKGKSVAVFIGHSQVFASKQRGWLEKLGLKVSSTSNQQQFGEFLKGNPDMIWMISSSSQLLSNDLHDKIIELYKKGTGLFIWADNDPYYVDANILLGRILGSDCRLEGNYPGQKTLKSVREGFGTGTFKGNHPVATGLMNLYEGYTICHPNQNLIDKPEVEIFAYNSNRNVANQPSIFYKVSPTSEGIVWVDTGFTKLYINTGSLEAETERYVRNVCEYICRKN